MEIVPTRNWNIQITTRLKNVTPTAFLNWPLWTVNVAKYICRMKMVRENAKLIVRNIRIIYLITWWLQNKLIIFKVGVTKQLLKIAKLIVLPTKCLFLTWHFRLVTIASTRLKLWASKRLNLIQYTSYHVFQQYHSNYVSGKMFVQSACNRKRGLIQYLF